MFLQVAALSLLSSLLAHCLNSGRVWLLALFLMNNTGLNHSAPCHGLWLVNAALTLASDWLLRWIIDGADIFADGWKWIIFHLGRSLSFFQVQLFEQRKETASEILSSAHLTWPPGENENKKSPSVKIFKTVGQTFSQSQFYNPGLGNPPQLSRVSQCHSLLTSQFADLNFVDSICSRPLCVWNIAVKQIADRKYHEQWTVCSLEMLLIRCPGLQLMMAAHDVNTDQWPVTTPRMTRGQVRLVRGQCSAVCCDKVMAPWWCWSPDAGSPSCSPVTITMMAVMVNCKYLPWPHLCNWFQVLGTNSIVSWYANY